MAPLLQIFPYHLYETVLEPVLQGCYLFLETSGERTSYGHLRPLAYYPAPYRNRPHRLGMRSEGKGPSAAGACD